MGYGHGVVDYYGSGFDYSWCEGYQCAHEYAIAGTLRQQPSQQVWDQIESAGAEFSQSVAVTPGDYKLPAPTIEDMYKPNYRGRGMAGRTLNAKQEPEK